MKAACMKLLPQRKKFDGLSIVIVVCLLVYIWYSLKDEVRAEKIELTSNGKTVAVINTNEDGEPELKLIGKDGQSILITPAGISAWGKTGRTSFNLQTGSTSENISGPGLTLFDSGGENRAAMYLSEGSPFLTFSSYDSIPNGGRRYSTN